MSFVPAFVLLLACTGVLGIGDQDALDFSAELVRPGSDSVPELAVEGGEGRIHVQGAVGTPVPCYDIAGTLGRADRVITLEVAATPQDVVCIQVVATFGYDATIRGLAPGPYRMRVVHTSPGGTETVLEQDVTVR